MKLSTACTLLSLATGVASPGPDLSAALASTLEPKPPVAARRLLAAPSSGVRPQTSPQSNARRLSAKKENGSPVAEESPGRILALKDKAAPIVIGKALGTPASLLRMSGRELRAKVWSLIGEFIGFDGDASFGDHLSLSGNGFVMAASTGGNASRPPTVRVFGYSPATGWTQRGNTIDGIRRSVISSDGRVLAGWDTTYSEHRGIVQVYEYVNNDWAQLGEYVVGDVPNLFLGSSISLSWNGKSFAVGAYGNAAVNSGKGELRVYDYDSNSKEWGQRGLGIEGKSSDAGFGHRVSLSSDGTTVAGGSFKDDRNAHDAGYVAVYKYVNGAWNQLGSDIFGAARDGLSECSLSANGRSVAVGAPQWSVDSGYVRVLDFNETTNAWTQRGGVIEGRPGSIGMFGISVALSADGSVVAAGAQGIPINDDHGYVRVLKYDDTSEAWSQKGEIVEENPGDQAAVVAISSDASIVAVGARGYDVDGANNRGKVRVFRFGDEHSPWTLEFQDLSVTFDADSEDEITLSYIIGTGREFETSLVQKGCNEANLVETDLYNVTNTTSQINFTHDSLILSYSIDKSALGSSASWKNKTSTFEVCQITQLVDMAPDPVGKIVVAEDKLEIGVIVNDRANFTIFSNLTEGETFNATEEVNAGGAVKAFKCDADFNENNDKLGPNTELFTCVGSADDAFKVDTLESMKISQGGGSQAGGSEFTVIAGDAIQVPSLTSRRYPDEGVIVGTRIPINLFDFSEGAVLVISGSIVMKLSDGSSRRLEVDLGTVTRDLQADTSEASYTVNVELEPEAEGPVQDVLSSSAAGLVAAGFEMLAVLSFFLLW